MEDSNMAALARTASVYWSRSVRIFEGGKKTADVFAGRKLSMATMRLVGEDNS